MKKLMCSLLAFVLLLSGCAGNFGNMELKDTLQIPENGIIEKAVIQQIRDAGAVAVFRGESNGLKYEWKLFAKDIADVRDVNLRVELTLDGEELTVSFAQQESLGFSSMLSIYLPSKWSYLTASAYQDDVKVYSVSLTGTKKESTLNIFVKDTLGTLCIRPDPQKDPAQTEPMHTHEYTASVTPPGCTEAGFTTYTCPCGDSYRDSEIAATGHSWGQWVTTQAPTEEAAGEARRTCAACQETEVRILPQLDPNHTHSYRAAVTAPTCEQAGYTTYTCSCGDSYRDDQVAATGHHYKTTTVAPTETRQGYDLHTCQSCGASYQDNYQAPTASETQPTDPTEPTKDEYLTDPVPPGMPEPVEPGDVVIDTDTVHTCYFSIECSTILNNLTMLNPAKLELLPSDGVILAQIEVSFYAGESVFDVLQRVCRENNIHMESSWTPMYNSAYVEGIANFYEFDCGELSGWMYRVNGWYPNYGCSRYQLQDGDVVEWRYTCDLGADVGDTWLGGT